MYNGAPSIIGPYAGAQPKALNPFRAAPETNLIFKKPAVLLAKILNCAAHSTTVQLELNETIENNFHQLVRFCVLHLGRK